jgi:hypothetical protein
MITPINPSMYMPSLVDETMSTLGAIRQHFAEHLRVREKILFGVLRCRDRGLSATPSSSPISAKSTRLKEYSQRLFHAVYGI